jgi:hypothetical protein
VCGSSSRPSLRQWQHNKWRVPHHTSGRRAAGEQHPPHTTRIHPPHGIGATGRGGGKPADRRSSNVSDLTVTPGTPSTLAAEPPASITTTTTTTATSTVRADRTTGGVEDATTVMTVIAAGHQTRGARGPLGRTCGM